MPYASPLTHVRAEGVFGSSASSPVEQWSFGFYVAGAELPAGYDAVLPDVWSALARYIGNSTNFATFYSDTWLTEVMAAEITPAGGLAQGYYSRYAAPGGAVSGVSNAGSAPYQLTSAVTLDAGKPAAGRFNRFYPPPQYGGTTLGLIAPEAAQARANVAKTMLREVATALSPTTLKSDWFGVTTVGVEFRPVVASKVHGSSRNIQAVRVGRVQDTQRRRRNSLPEGYVTATT
jgi:hypothetical protein